MTREQYERAVEMSATIEPKKEQINQMQKIIDLKSHENLVIGQYFINKFGQKMYKRMNFDEEMYQNLCTFFEQQIERLNKEIDKKLAEL